MDFKLNKQFFLFCGLLFLSIWVIDFFKEDSLINTFFNETKFYSKVNNDGVKEVEVYFCPKENCAKKIIDEINIANKSIDIAAYSFTIRDIFDSLKLAKQKGVRIRVIFDYLQSFNAYSLDENLINIDVPILRKKGVGQYGVMHNKFVIIDGEKVFTGSFNYSINANENNFENLVFIRDEKIAEKYLIEFNEIWFN